MGGQLVLRAAPNKMFSGWVSYALSRSERRIGPEAAWRLFDFDQTHVLVASASVEPWKNWRFGARVRASSGYPRTRAEGSVYDSRVDAYQPTLGPHNADRLPAFIQGDLHAEHAVDLSFATLRVYLDVINVTNRSNAEEVVYGYDYQERGYLTGLPLMALLGARLEL